jgi:cell division protein FtsB
MRLPHVRSRVRSLMLAVLIVAVIAWLGVLGWRRAQFLELSQHFRDQAATYREARQREADAIAEVAKLEREAASARPPAAGAAKSAWRAHRDNLSDLQAKLKIARAWLDQYERYDAVRRYSERLAAKYQRAAARPWLSVESESRGAE